MVSTIRDHLYFLDHLRSTGKINMFTAKPLLMKQFGISYQEADVALKQWMKTFRKRYKQVE